jgi:drug/metabolite transporter (DMT)-like permease
MKLGVYVNQHLSFGCIPAQKVSVMMTAGVPLVAAFGVLYLGEPIRYRLRVGALLIFGSGIGLNLRPDKSTSN